MAGVNPQPEPSLTAELIVWAYSQGLFPMADSRHGRIGWYNPDPRAVLPLEAFHVPHVLARKVRKGLFEIRMDTAFEQVIRCCADPRPYQRESWINQPIIDAYVALHHTGLAHSVEAWIHPVADAEAGASTDAQLVGGLYGVTLGAAFFGESMFSKVTDASKICLVHLVEHLRRSGFVLLDVQLRNRHLEQFGIIDLPRDEYLRRLRRALRLPTCW